MPSAQGHLALSALADAIATVTGLLRPATPSAASRCELWAHDADDTLTPADGGAYTVLRIFAATPAGTAANRVAVQAYTRGKTTKAALIRAALIFDALLDGSVGAEDRYPKRAWVVGESPNQWTVDIFDPIEPALVSRDDQGRSEVVSNFEMAYRKVPA